MSVDMVVDIWIGGKLRRSLLQKLLAEELHRHLGEASEQGVLDACRNRLLHLDNEGVNYETFDNLEAWLRRHEIPYVKETEGDFDSEPTRTQFRPDLPSKPDLEIATNHNGDTVVTREQIEPWIERMATLVSDKDRPEAARLQDWEEVYKSVASLLPPLLPWLPDFEIVDG